jgi:ubiquinone/menaquinone biosynthesis C-methylase UbiE
MALFASLRSRQRQPEWMDDPAADPADLRRSLGYIRRINALLGYTRATVGHLKRFGRGWRRGETIRILDVATGSADIPRAVLRWSAGAGFDVRIVAIDLHHATLKLAAEATVVPAPSAGTPGEGRGEGSFRSGISDSRFQNDPHANPLAEYGSTELAEVRERGLGERLRFVQADALRLPFADRSFDYALTAMFLHHLDDDAAAAALREMARVSRRGIVAADLLRHRRAYAWVTLLTLTAGPMVKHDARASVAQAFTKPEVLRLRDQAGIGFARYHRHFGHRFALAGER